MNAITKIKISLILIAEAISAFALLSMIHIYFGALVGPIVAGFYGFGLLRNKYQSQVGFRFIAELGVYVALVTLILFVGFNVLFGLSAGGRVPDDVTIFEILLQQIQTNWLYALILSCGITLGVLLQYVFVQANK